jgi:metal-responsive CopG/Arc/MetJ family transcriptional regulator
LEGQKIESTLKNAKFTDDVISVTAIVQQGNLKMMQQQDACCHLSVVAGGSDDVSEIYEHMFGLSYSMLCD